MKPGAGGEFCAEALLQFQPTLCAALFELDHTYRSILAEEKRLIRRKSTYSPEWFRGRMKTLARYKGIITQTIKIGKSLGDSYAWFFYHHEPALLAEHAKHARQLYWPSGIGGRGEYEFSKRIRHVLGRFSLYHGMTHMLRLGDVSLIDPSTFKVSALGELKTTEVSHGKLDLMLKFVGSSWEDVPKFPNQQDHIQLAPLSPHIAAKLERQVGQMADAMSVRMRLGQAQQLEFEGYTYFTALNEALQATRRSRFSYRQLSNGFLLVLYRMGASKLSSRVMADTNQDYFTDELPTHLAPILQQTSAHNRLYYGSFIPSQGPLLGTMPIFWWPLDSENIRQIMFEETLIFTFYNTTCLLERLRDAGFIVSFNEAAGEYEVKKSRNGHKLIIENFSYFLRLIQQCFFTEEKVVELLQSFIAATAGMEQQGTRVRVELFIHQALMGERPVNV